MFNLYKQNNLFISLFIVAVGLLISFGVVVSAQENDPLLDIEYPISELGNCENERNCMAYCDQIDHLEQCLNFAEEHELLTDEELEEAHKFLDAGAEGPGGCTSRESCDAFCSDISHIDELDSLVVIMTNKTPVDVKILSRTRFGRFGNFDTM